mgnify:CR=1 FL=1
MILNLSNFIHSLLLENETVIIPGFGAFVSTYKPAEIGESQIKPPAKEITFTNKIKNNDGLLVEIIARSAKISQKNALKRIEKARENMFYELDKGNTVTLENIGNLSYNEKNEIVFQPIEENNLLIDSFGFEPVSKKENISESADVKSAVIEKEDAKPIVGSVKSESSENKNEKEKQNSSAESFRLPEFQPAPAIEEDEEEKKKFAWYWYLLILIPIMIGVYYIIMNQPETPETKVTQNTSSVVNEQSVNESKISVKDTVKKDTQATEKIPEPVISKPKESNTAFQGKSGKFYLIRGGFEEEENVKEYMQELKKEGVESFVVGKTGRLILVGIEEFETEEEANKSLNSYFKTKPDWKLWVYKVK